MANRLINQFSYSFGRPYILRMTVNIGASGAPTIVSGTGRGISSIARVSAGKYDIVLQDTYAQLMGVSETIKSGTSAPAAPSMNIDSESVATAASKAIRITHRDLSGTAADPASGEVLFLEISLENSSTGH